MWRLVAEKETFLERKAREAGPRDVTGSVLLWTCCGVYLGLLGRPIRVPRSGGLGQGVLRGLRGQSTIPGPVRSRPRSEYEYACASWATKSIQLARS